MSIDLHDVSCYNMLVNESGKVDEAQTNRLNKLLEWLRQHGKTAHQNYYPKGEMKMSANEITTKIEALRELE